MPVETEEYTGIVAAGSADASGAKKLVQRERWLRHGRCCTEKEFLPGLGMESGGDAQILRGVRERSQAEASVGGAHIKVTLWRWLTGALADPRLAYKMRPQGESDIGEAKSGRDVQGSAKKSSGRWEEIFGAASGIRKDLGHSNGVDWKGFKQEIDRYLLKEFSRFMFCEIFNAEFQEFLES
ncbi:hypothetical protein B0H14DRAFT_2635772 [Mycena olivaceomarginata]|nr:hypothetical protein B0H14DRAFT_2635772 [Mycena olivaceomarginata]